MPDPTTDALIHADEFREVLHRLDNIVTAAEHGRSTLVGTVIAVHDVATSIRAMLDRCDTPSAPDGDP